MVLGRGARECSPTAEGSSNPHTSVVVRQCEGTVVADANNSTLLHFGDISGDVFEKRAR